MRSTLLLAALLLAGAAIAQSKPTKADTVALDELLFKRSINAQFSKIIDPSANTNVGNYAALETKDAAVTLGASSMGPKGNIWAIKFSGGISDGLSTIWQDRELDPEVSAGLQWHWLSKQRRLIFDTDSGLAAMAVYQQLKTEARRCTLAVQVHDKVIKLQSELRKAREDLVRPMKDSTALKTALIEFAKVPATQRNAAWVQASQDSTFKYNKVVAELALARFALAEKEQKYKAEEANDKDPEPGLRACQKEFAHAYNKMLTPLAAGGVDLSWLSLGIGYTSTKFKLYNDSAAFGDQVKKRVNGAVELRAQWSRYHRAKGYSANYFFGLGVSGGVTDNHDDLTEVTLEDRSVTVGPDSVTRTQIANYKVLKGAYNKDLLTGSLFVDAYYFIGKGNNSAVHLFPSYRVKDKETPSFDIGGGFLVGYVQKDKAENTINVEFFVQLKDLFNAAGKKGDAWDRSDIGLRLSFPFNFPHRS